MRKDLAKYAMVAASILALPGCFLTDKISQSINEGVVENMTGADIDTAANDSGKKSENWPSNIPTHENGTKFSYSKWGTSYILGYDVPSSTGALKDVASSIDKQLVSAGWTTDGEASVFESDDSSLRTYANTDSTLLLTLNKEEGSTDYTVSIVSAPKVTTK